jgi:hypothetical protein
MMLLKAVLTDELKKVFNPATILRGQDAATTLVPLPTTA